MTVPEHCWHVLGERHVPVAEGVSWQRVRCCFCGEYANATFRDAPELNPGAHGAFQPFTCEVLVAIGSVGPCRRGEMTD